MMRPSLACLLMVSMVLSACMSWRPPAADEKWPHEGHVLAVTTDWAYELDVTGADDTQLRGTIIRAWRTGNVEPAAVDDNLAPDEVAATLRWVEVPGRAGQPVALPRADARVTAVGESNARTVVTRLAMGAVFLVVYVVLVAHLALSNG